MDETPSVLGHNRTGIPHVENSVFVNKQIPNLSPLKNSVRTDYDSFSRVG